MNLFDYNTKKSRLLSDYGQQGLAQETGRMLGQQRFSRQRSDLNRQMVRSFPQFTGQWAGRLGSNVKSGVFGQKLGEFTGDFQRRLQDVDLAAAQQQAGWTQEDLNRKIQLEQLLAQLKEQALASGLKIQ